jgi:hypothetical protein
VTNSSNFNIVDQSDAFKIRFTGVMKMQYNNANVTWMKCKKTYTMTGKAENRAIGLSDGSGFGTGSLPQVSSDSASYAQASITHKKVYSVVEIDRLAMKAGKNSEGIFDASALEHVAKKAVTSLNRNMSRILFGNADGKLYTGNASNANVSGAGTSGSPYIVGMNGTLASVIWANFEEGDLVNVNTETTVLSIAKVVKTAGSEALQLVGTSARLAALAATGPFTTSDSLVVQGSLNNDPTGLGMIQNTSGSTYGVDQSNRRFQGNAIAAGGVTISEDLLNQLVLTVEEESGETPDLIVGSYFQFRKIKDFLGDNKRFIVEPRDSELKGKVSFSALSFMSASGEIPIVADRFVRKDYVFALNTNHIEVMHAPDFGWMSEEGEPIFLRRDTADRYQARYGGYMNIFIEPRFQGVITGLAII